MVDAVGAILRLGNNGGKRGAAMRQVHFVAHLVQSALYDGKRDRIDVCHGNAAALKRDDQIAVIVTARPRTGLDDDGCVQLPDNGGPCQTFGGTIDTTSGVSGTSVSVRLNLGGRRLINQKNTNKQQRQK